MELDQPNFQFKPEQDRRPHMTEPPPVRVGAVADVHLRAAAGVEVELDSFYVGLLQFQRENPNSHGPVIYRAENFRLIFDVQEPPVQREDMRPAHILVRSLKTLERQLIDLEIEFEWHRGLTPGTHQLVLQDPAKNWIAISEWREVR